MSQLCPCSLPSHAPLASARRTCSASVERRSSQLSTNTLRQLRAEQIESTSRVRNPDPRVSARACCADGAHADGGVRAPQLQGGHLGAPDHLPPGSPLQTQQEAVASWEGGPQEQEAPLFILGKSLSSICTWGVGGPAKYFIEVFSEAEMLRVLDCCRRRGIRALVVGRGSNCLFDDRGFDGCVVLSRIDFVEDRGGGAFRAGSGAPFNHLGVRCASLGFSGLEFAAGIPGTVGGAVYMNAGANGQETAQVLESVEVVTPEGARRTLRRERGELVYGYRRSPFQSMGAGTAVVAATFRLTHDPGARRLQRSFMDRRRKTQPVLERTAGCVFRNPSAGSSSAGALIDRLGLKGRQIGGAQVSEKHANFLINVGGSKAADILSLITLIKEQVERESGVVLQEEILYIPYSDGLH